MKIVAKLILHKILGWTIEGVFPNTPKKYVVIAAPHTSWVDFPIAILTRMSLGTMIHFIAKQSLFKFPFGFFFRYLGGTPIDRSKNNNSVDTIVKMFNEREEFKLGISPEGTRKKVENWKTGFYYIAKESKVPIVMVSLDFERKKVKISKPYYTTEDKAKDFILFTSFYKGVIGKNIELS